jgi:hypothetical protein
MKITQLAKILMAVDHVEGYCKFKKLKYDRHERTNTNQLAYDAISKETDAERKDNYQAIAENFFENYGDRTEYAVEQIDVINKYLEDFRLIKAAVEGKDASKSGPAKKTKNEKGANGAKGEAMGAVAEEPEAEAAQA